LPRQNYKNAQHARPLFFARSLLDVGAETCTNRRAAEPAANQSPARGRSAIEEIRTTRRYSDVASARLNLQRVEVGGKINVS
jgi:hypothetical protein